MSLYQVKTPTLLEDFETFADWTIATGTGAVDNTIFKTGAGSLQLTSALGTNCFATKTINLDMSQSTQFVCWVYFASIAEVASVTFYLSNDSSFTNFFAKSFTSTVHEGWNKLVVGRSQWTTNGAAVWSSNMIRLRVRVTANASSTAIAYFDSAFYGGYNRPKVLLTFDDGWASQYTIAYPILKAYGFKGTCYIIQARIDDGVGGHMSTAQIQELHAAGWDMCNHTQNHNDMGAYSQADGYAEFAGCRDYLKSLGFTRRNEHLHSAYPYGHYSTGVLAAMPQAGLLTGRTTIDRTQAHTIDNQYLLTRQQHDYTMTAAFYKACIDRVVADGGSIAINYHIIRPSGGTVTTEVYTSQFQDLMDYIAPLHYGGVLDVVTFTEWYDGLMHTRKRLNS